MEMQEFADRLLKLAVVLNQYDTEGAHWAEVCAEADARHIPEPYDVCVRHSEALEQLAHDLASAARSVLDAP